MLLLVEQCRTVLRLERCVAPAAGSRGHFGAKASSPLELKQGSGENAHPRGSLAHVWRKELALNLGLVKADTEFFQSADHRIEIIHADGGLMQGSTNDFEDFIPKRTA